MLVEIMTMLSWRLPDSGAADVNVAVKRMVRRRCGNCIVLWDALDGVVRSSMCLMKWEVDGLDVEGGEVRVADENVLTREIFLYSSLALKGFVNVGGTLSVLLGVPLS